MHSAKNGTQVGEFLAKSAGSSQNSYYPRLCHSVNIEPVHVFQHPLLTVN